MSYLRKIAFATFLKRSLKTKPKGVYCNFGYVYTTECFVRLSRISHTLAFLENWIKLIKLNKSFVLTRIPKILKPFFSAAILHFSNMSWMLSFFPWTVAILRPRTIFAFLLCSLKHPSDFHATAAKEFGRSQWAKMLSSNLVEKKQTYGLKHLSSDKSDFCSLCLTKHCSKFPPKVSLGT